MASYLRADSPGLGATPIHSNGDVQQYISVHVRLDNNEQDVIHRILHTNDISLEDVNQSLRYLIPALESEQICLADAEGEVVSIKGVVPAGEYWLLTSGAACGCEDVDSGDEQAPATAKEKRVEKKHRVRGHDYTARHFHTVQICDHCRNPMFGLGKQGYICRKCAVVVHKKCHLDYLVECGESPENLPQCARCKTRYNESENSDTACSYHVAQTGKLWCKKCMQPPYLGAEGCMVGRHIRKENTGKKRPKVMRLLSKAQTSAPKSVSAVSVDERPVSCECPQHLANEVLDREYVVPVAHVYDLFFGHNPRGFIAMQARLGYTDMQIGEWENDSGYVTRSITYKLPTKTACSKTLPVCTERQYLRWKHNGRAFSVTLSLDCPDLPYGDAYATYVTVCVASTGQHSSRMIVTCEPRFHVTDASRWKELFEKVVQTLVDTKTRMDVINVCKLLGEVMQEEESKYIQEHNLTKPQGEYGTLTFPQLMGGDVVKQPTWVTALVLCSFLVMFITTWVMYTRIQEMESLVIKLGLGRAAEGWRQ